MAEFRAPTAAAPILPPRPNLGPEPWADPVWSPRAWLALGGGALLLVLLVWWLRRRAAARARRSESSAPPHWEDPASLPPRRRMLQWSEMVRGALIARFGDSWAAKTTEEIADEPDLANLLGPEQREELLRFLRASDRAKFAHETDGDEPGQGEDWDGWAAEFVAATGPAAGATSRIKGR